MAEKCTKNYQPECPIWSDDAQRQRCAATGPIGGDSKVASDLKG